MQTEGHRAKLIWTSQHEGRLWCRVNAPVLQLPQQLGLLHEVKKLLFVIENVWLEPFHGHKDLASCGRSVFADVHCTDRNNMKNLPDQLWVLRDLRKSFDEQDQA